LQYKFYPNDFINEPLLGKNIFDLNKFNGI